MKLNCKVIEDLLPLYLDDICSEESREIVEEHLKECEECRKLIHITETVSVPQIIPKKTEKDRIIIKGFRKLRRHWLVSLFLVIILIPASVLGWNQIRNNGLHYTNIDEYLIGQKFMEHLYEGNYEKAYEYINSDRLKQNWLRDFDFFNEENLANLREDGLAKFCEIGSEIEQAGGITAYEYIGISGGRNANQVEYYTLVFKVLFNGEEQTLDITVINGQVFSIDTSDGHIYKNLLAKLAVWGEFLWRDYTGYTPDFDLTE